MLSLADPQWKTLEGGYRVRYDASVALRRLEAGEDVWEELWEELHHQGDVGEASYAAVPHIVKIAAAAAARDWNFWGLISIIEIERHRKSNPRVPAWALESYKAAWDQVLGMATHDLSLVTDRETVQCIVGAVALAKGCLKLGAHIAKLDSSELDEILEDRDAWSQLYA